MKTVVDRKGLKAPLLFLIVYSIFFSWNIGHFLGKNLFAAGDIGFYVLYTDAAAAALHKLQFPLMYDNGGSFMLQPSFLYYSTLFPTISGLMEVVLHVNSYDAGLLTVALMVFVGASGIYLSARQIGLSVGSSLLGCIAYLSNPYLITDMFARSAFSEICAFGMLPIWMLFAIRFGQAPSWRRLALLAVGYALVILGHKIFAIWTLSFGFLLVLLRRRTWLSGIAGHIAGLAIGLFITLPLWANSAIELQHLTIAHMDMSPTIKLMGAARNDFFDGPPNSVGITWAFINSDLSSLFPFPYVHPFSTTPHLYLQVGLIILTAIFLFRPTKASHQERIFFFLTISSLLLSASLLHALPFWRFVPQPLTIIQIPFRILTYTTIFGSILVCLVVERQATGRTPLVAGLALVLCLAHLAIFHHRPDIGPTAPLQAIESKLVSSDYKSADGPSASNTLEPSAIALHDLWPGNCVKGSVTAAAGGQTILPIAYSSRLLALIDGHRVPMTEASDGHLVLPLDPGIHSLRVCRSEPIPVFPFYAAVLSVGIAFGLWFFFRRRVRRTIGTPHQGRPVL